LDVALEPVALLDARPASCSLWKQDEIAAVTCQATIDAHEPEYANSVVQTGTPPRMPAPQFTAELEPLPTADELLEPPEMCQQWMPILPSAANTPLVLVRQEVSLALPPLPQSALEPFAAPRPSAPPPAPEAVESLLVAALAAAPVSIKHAPSRSADLDAPPAFVQPAPALGKPAAGPAPAALESLLVASVAARLAPVIPARMLPFAMAAGREGTLPSFNAMRLAPSVRKSRATASRLAGPQPIATVAVSSPANLRQPLESALPRPGLVPIEFHTHSLRSGPVSRPEWKQARPTLVAPKFQLSLVPEKLEDPNAQPRNVRKQPEVVKILNMPAAKRPPTVLMVFGRVAAGFLLVAALWFGLNNVRSARQLAIREVPSSAPAISAANSAGPGKASNGGAPVRTASKGAAAWVRHVIADRAALKMDENFHGLDNWDIDAKTKDAGWSRHPDGYMNTGALALFRPTLKFNDYRMEFFGQIETKSIGWTVRATDAKNYHAMKLTVIEAGLRPFVALVQYNVVNGKSGHRTQTPLSVMVHNNTPLQFAVDVRGNRFVTSINGEEVDSFIDTTLTAGGVGFFSEAGERARLYWMKFTRNDDWLGHVCALLAEEAGAARAAELRQPEIPGDAPLPGLPKDSYGPTLSAVWIGLPYLRATRKTRFFKTWRSEPWNT
jgi:hypothetical protein